MISRLITNQLKSFQK